MGWLSSRNQECSSRLQGIGNQQGGYQSDLGQVSRQAI